jgi:pimeloyl-ACP methyl ester carboxylesterase
MPAWTGQASVRYGWPPHVIEHAGHLVVAEPPEALLEALRAALGNR